MLGLLLFQSLPAQGATCPRLVTNEISCWGAGGCYQTIIVGVCSQQLTQLTRKCVPCLNMSYSCLTPICNAGYTGNCASAPEVADNEGLKLLLARGETAFVPACTGGYTLLQGTGTL